MLEPWSPVAVAVAVAVGFIVWGLVLAVVACVWKRPWAGPVLLESRPPKNSLLKLQLELLMMKGFTLGILVLCISVSARWIVSGTSISYTGLGAVEGLSLLAALPLCQN